MAKVCRCLSFIFLLIAPVQVMAIRTGPHSSRVMKTMRQSLARRRGPSHPAYAWGQGPGHTAPPLDEDDAATACASNNDNVPEIIQVANDANTSTQTPRGDGDAPAQPVHND